MLGILVASAALLAQPLTQGERDRAVRELEGTRQRFLEAIRGLSPAQWNFKPGPDRWSVAECAEHVTLAEDLYFELVTKQLMQSAADPSKKREVQGKDDMVLATMRDRTSKRVAGEAIQPTHRWATPAEVAAEFNRRRDRTVNYVKTTKDELRSHFQTHRAVGLIDGYQWFLLAAGHTDRHLAQAAEVKASPGYPQH